jgi:superfamily I DNA/RNA helicase
MIESMIGGVRSFSIDSGMSRGYQANEVESFSDFAVLCRTGHMFEELTKAFNSHGIPYQLVGEEPFYRRKPYRAFIQHAKKIYQNKIPTEDTIGDILRAKKPLIDVFRELNRNFKLSDEEFSDFTRFVQPFSNDYEAFFQAISLRRGIDEYNRTQEAVSLMTMHASKGLEFTVVFIPACEQGIIPFEIFGKKAEREEEARLLYVAMTRTQRYLFLSHADKRYIKGRILKNERSPLIKRVSKELFQTFSRPEKYTPSDKQLYLF